MSSIRILHTTAPEDAPTRDLFVWTPMASDCASGSRDFAAWWSTHEESLWIGVDMTRADTKTFANVYETIMKPEYAVVRFTIYTGKTWTDDSKAPCGCTGRDGVCEYHRDGEDEIEVAPCGCSEKYAVTCEYHTSEADA